MTFSLIIRDLIVDAHIGITDAEQQNSQRLRINVTVELDASVNPQNDDMAETVDYNEIVQSIRELALKSRFKLLETFAQNVGQRALIDPRAQAAIVRIEKLDLYDDIASVGIELKIQNKFYFL